jgi:tetratricopeptide (TPR) repeat protein
VQDEIAAGVVDAVKARLAPGSHALPARPPARNLEAYRCYLRGRHLRHTIEDHAGALSAFEDAVRIDPSHAPSWTGLAELNVLAAHFSLVPAREACAAARAALSTAERLQGESADALYVEGFVAFIERRWQAMEVAYRRAIDLQPGHVQALAAYGVMLSTRQKLPEALPFFRRAEEADPLAAFPYSLTGGGLLVCGRPEDALQSCEDSLSFEQDNLIGLWVSAMALIHLGRKEEGIARAKRAVAVSQRGPHFLGLLGWALATSGQVDAARTILDEMRARPAGSPTAVSEAWLLGALGETDAAFEVLARAEAEYQPFLYYTGLPAFDPLRVDARFTALLGRLSLPVGETN